MPLSTTSDAMLIEGGNLPLGFAPLVTGVDAVVQRVFMRLSMHRGEWAFDPNAGAPWNFWMSRPTPPLPLIESFVRSTVASTPGVARVNKITSNYDRPSQEVTLTFEAVIDNSVVELQFQPSNARYGNVSPYVTYRVLSSPVYPVS